MKDWREELDCNIFYKKKFALTSVLCSDGTKVLWKNYYAQYKEYSNKFDESDTHTDHVENITEAEYIVRKLIEGF